MKEAYLKSTVVGKDTTKGLQTPRFRLHSGETNPQDLVVFHYGLLPRAVNQQPEVDVTNTYNVVDILNECIDDYHERHKDD